MSDFNDGILPTPCLRMDTHFGDEYESVEFGDGTGYIKAAPILAKVGALHGEIDRLQDENAELRKERDVLDATNDGLLAENAKLRELVRDMWEFGFGCNSGANDAWAWHERTDALEERMRELGVEV